MEDPTTPREAIALAEELGLIQYWNRSCCIYYITFYGEKKHRVPEHKVIEFILGKIEGVDHAIGTN